MDKDMGEQSQRDCPVCGFPGFRLWYRFGKDEIQRRWNVSDTYLLRQRFGDSDHMVIARCRSCGMYYNRNCHNWSVCDSHTEGEGKRGETWEPDVHIDGAMQVHALAALGLKTVMDRRKERYFRNANLKVLDYSCGGGSLLKALSSFGIKNLYGYDIVQEAPNLGGMEFQYLNNLSDLGRHAPFDIVFCNSSMEHYDNPLKSLRGIRQMLSPSGLFCIGVPTLDYRKFGKYKRKKLDIEPARGYFHPWHINHFSVTSFARILRETGFSILPVTSPNLTDPDFIDWNSRKSLIMSFRRMAMTVLRLKASWIFFRRQWYPGFFKRFYFNGYFICRVEQ